jgi:hypothetical protein
MSEDHRRDMLTRLDHIRGECFTVIAELVAHSSGDLQDALVLTQDAANKLGMAGRELAIAN